MTNTSTLKYEYEIKKNDKIWLDHASLGSKQASVLHYKNEMKKLKTEMIRNEVKDEYV